MPRFLTPLSLGLALGGSVTWSVTRSSSAATAPIINHPSSFINAWSWRDSALPPALSDRDAFSAVAAWHALRAPDGSPADFSARADALRALLARLPSIAFPRLLAPLARAGLSADDLALRQIAFSAWIGSAPAAATAWAVAAPDLQDLADQALSAWSARDPRAASTWACALPDEPVARRLAALALPVLAEVDPAQAIALASSRGDAFLDALLPNLLAALAKSDPASALRTYGPRLWRNGDGFWPLRHVLGEWASRDPAAAIAWISAQPDRNRGQIGRWLSDLAPEGSQRLAIANALATLPDVPYRHDALGAVIAQWATKDLAAAVAWLDALPDRHLRNSILEYATRTRGSGHPEQLLPLALTMPEGGARTTRLGTLLGKWAENDASAALAWLRANSSAQAAALLAANPGLKN